MSLTWIIETYNKGKCLVIAVRDQGIGIAPEYQKKFSTSFSEFLMAMYIM
jgi:signal transduction histidine kinase